MSKERKMWALADKKGDLRTLFLNDATGHIYSVVAFDTRKEARTALNNVLDYKGLRVVSLQIKK